jgi:hypothetical protein
MEREKRKRRRVFTDQLLKRKEGRGLEKKSHI